MIKCKECGKEVSSSAKTCPGCGAPVEKHLISAGGCLVIVLLLGAILIFMRTCEGPSPEEKSAQAIGAALADYQRAFAKDMIQQYEITKRSGSAQDASFRAAAVAEMYLQAKDEENYKKWKAIADEEQERATATLLKISP